MTWIALEKTITGPKNGLKTKKARKRVALERRHQFEPGDSAIVIAGKRRIRPDSLPECPGPAS
jgi:hypothetical protein